jgi:hypothetical protein
MKHQYPRYVPKKEDIPCKSCKKFDSCIIKIDELKDHMYGNDYINGEEDMHFHTDIMDLLTKDCQILYDYHPYIVVSRDGLMRPYQYQHKHWKASERQNMDEEEWGERECNLYYFFLEYNVKETED